MKHSLLSPLFLLTVCMICCPNYAVVPIKELAINSAGVLPYATDQYGIPYFLMGQSNSGNWDAFHTEPTNNESTIDTATRALIEKSNNVLSNFGLDSITLKKKLTGDLKQLGIYRIHNTANKRILYIVPIRLTNNTQTNTILKTFIASQKEADTDTTSDIQQISWIKCNDIYTALNNNASLLQQIQVPAAGVATKVSINPSLIATLETFSYYQYPWNPPIIGNIASGLDALEDLLAKKKSGGTIFGSSYKMAGILPYIKRNNQVLVLVKKQSNGTFSYLGGTVIPADKWDAITTATRNFVTQYQLKSKAVMTVAEIEQAITTKGMALQELVTTEETMPGNFIYPLKITGDPIMATADLVWINAAQLDVTTNNWQNYKIQGRNDINPNTVLSIQLSKDLTAAVLNDRQLAEFYGNPQSHIIKRIQRFEPVTK